MSRARARTSSLYGHIYRWTVYRHIADDGQVLYIGMTSNPKHREIGHRRESAWWPQVARVEYEPQPDRDAALAREMELIRLYDPPHNIVGTPRWQRHPQTQATA